MDKLSREENWKSFCTHHAVGDWHGIFLKYSSEGELVEESRIIRSFYHIPEINQIIHHNHYIYPNGQSKSVTFRNLNQDNCKAIYLEGSFTWGNERFVSGTPMGSEIGFKQADKRVSASFIYADDGQIKAVYLIIEKLTEIDSASFPVAVAIESFDSNLEKRWSTIQIVNSDWEYHERKMLFQQIRHRQESDLEMLTINNNNIRLSCPKLIREDSSFSQELEWFEPSICLTGIRTYSQGCFEKFELRTFRLEE